MIEAKLPRGNRSTLLQVDLALVTSELIYDIGLVSRGGSTSLQIFDSVYNKMVRLASGAFWTTLINSVLSEADIPSFNLLTTQSTGRLSGCTYRNSVPLSQSPCKTEQPQVIANKNQQCLQI